jgi:WD40 repeat protein
MSASFIGESIIIMTTGIDNTSLLWNLEKDLNLYTTYKEKKSSFIHVTYLILFYYDQNKCYAYLLENNGDTLIFKEHYRRVYYVEHSPSNKYILTISQLGTNNILKRERNQSLGSERNQAANEMVKISHALHNLERSSPALSQVIVWCSKGVSFVSFNNLRSEIIDVWFNEDDLSVFIV